MDNSDFDPSSDEFKDSILKAARSDFAQFYLTATGKDEALMDALVLAQAALTVTINTPRAHVPAVIRDGLERTGDDVERLYTKLREEVRTCPTFDQLFASERAQIERSVFAVKAPL